MYRSVGKINQSHASTYSYLENHLFISRTDYSHLTGRNKKVAIEELNSFITDGTIRKEGVGKLTVYIKV